MWKKLLDSPKNEVKHHSRYYLFSYLGRILSPFSLFLFSTFFECETDIPFISIYSESKIMEDTDQKIE